MNFAKWYTEMEQSVTFPDPRKYYLACVLNPLSQHNLKNFAENKYLEQMSQRIPNNWVFKCHHTTVKFNCTLQDFQKFQNLFEETIQIKVLYLAWDDNCIAAKIATHPTVPGDNSDPHITIAHSNNVKADYSNAMLANKNNIKPQTNHEMELPSVFLAVLKYDQTKTWPVVNYPLAAPSLVS